MSTTTEGLVTGEQLIALFHAAAAQLTAEAKAIDAINVYPVPDGDTGSNMSATLREAAATAQGTPEPRTTGAVLKTLARGALYGARGNSGVILSQALRGLAKAGEASETFDAAGLAAGLESAAEAAYGAVSKPVEGTMLTVLRAAADGARSYVTSLPGAGAGLPCAGTLSAAVRSAELAESLTPMQLPALAEAGVTDSGGEGICVIFRGLLAALTGTVLSRPIAVPERPIAELAGHAPEEFGFCTEFLIEPAGLQLDLDRLREVAGAGSNRSIVVVGDETAARVHAHCDDPDALLRAAGEMGRLSRVKVEDMGTQHRRFEVSGSGAGAKLAMLALSPGPGFDAIFESLGAIPSSLGTILKPAAGDLAAAADALRLPDVILLPNHPNVLLAAGQARELSRSTLTVIPSRTLPQGIAAAFAFDPNASLAENAEAMTEAMTAITTVEVTTAAADRSAEGIAVRAGDAIALVDDRLVCRATSAIEALVGGLRIAGAADAGLITLYTGVDAEGEPNAAEALARSFPGVTVEVVEGGQALYSYIASVES